MIWANGEKIEDPRLFDQGFWFGRGVFETIRVHQWPIFWNEHIQRLNAGLDRLKIRPPVDPDRLLKDVERLGIRDCVLKVAVTPENILFQTRDLPPEPSQNYYIWPTMDLLSQNPLLRQTKSLNYLEHLLAREEASSHGYDDALYVDRDSKISETCRANIFFVRDGRIHTPDLTCGLLDGIVRQWVIRTVAVETGQYVVQDLLDAEGVFVTNSVIGIQPVFAIGEHKVLTCRLIDEIHERYLCDTELENCGPID